MHFIKYKEQELLCIIDYMVVKYTCERLGIPFSEFDNIFVLKDAKQIETCFYEALKRGHKREGKEFNINESDIEEIFAEIGLGDIYYVYGQDVSKISQRTIESTPKKN